MIVIPNAVRDRLATIGATFRRIAGMPNYEAYLAHLRAHHPECAVPSEKEYFELYLAGKYNGVGNRCC